MSLEKVFPFLASRTTSDSSKKPKPNILASSQEFRVKVDSKLWRNSVRRTFSSFVKSFFLLVLKILEKCWMEAFVGDVRLERHPKLIILRLKRIAWKFVIQSAPSTEADLIPPYVPSFHPAVGGAEIYSNDEKIIKHGEMSTRRRRRWRGEIKFWNIWDEKQKRKFNCHVALFTFSTVSLYLLSLFGFFFSPRAE